MIRIKMMAEFFCWPLWHVGPGEVGNIDPETLPISPELIAAVSEWAARWDATFDDAYPPDSVFSSREAEEKFHEDGLELLQQLRAQLGSGYGVEYRRT